MYTLYPESYIYIYIYIQYVACNILKFIENINHISFINNLIYIIDATATDKKKIDTHPELISVVSNYLSFFHIVQQKDRKAQPASFPLNTRSAGSGNSYTNVKLTKPRNSQAKSAWNGNRHSSLCLHCVVLSYNFIFTFKHM